LLSRLTRACDCFMTPGHPNYLDFREREKDIWRQRAGIFTVLPTLNALATAYVFTGRTEFADFARDAVVEIMNEGLADVQSQAFGNPHEGWRHGPGHDKGKFAFCMAWVYDTCFDRFSSEQRAQLAEHARDCIAFAEEERTFDYAQIANNRGIAGVMVPVIFGLVLEGEADLGDLEALMTTGVVAIEKYLFLSFDAEGAPFEGPGYAGRIGFVAFLAEMIHRRGGPDLLTNNRFERFLDYLLYELLPGGWSANDLNDARMATGSAAGCLHLMGTDRGALLPWLIRQLDLHPDRIEPRLEDEEWSPGILDLYQVLPFLLHWDDNAPARAPEELGYPASHFFRKRGVASMRTGWDKEDFLVSHFCGPQELYCHRQGDYNHLSLYALGESFLVDAGYGPPFKDMSQPVDRWFGLSSSHNCVLIDGLEQRGVVSSPGWAEGEMLDFATEDAFDTSLGDASSSTGPEHRVRRALRRVAFVRRAPQPFVVVLDVNERDGQPFRAEHLWTTHPENRMEQGKGGFVIFGKQNRCEARVLWPAEPEIRLVDNYGRPQARVSVEAPVSEVVTAFYPCREGESPPEFTCERESEARYRLTCEFGQTTLRLHLAACFSGPMRQPAPTTLEPG